MCMKNCPYLVYYGDCSKPASADCPDDDYCGWGEDYSYENATPLQKLVIEEMEKELSRRKIACATLHQ